MEYEKLLDRAIKNMPEVILTKERFEIPKVRGHIQGNKTIISNFHQIAHILRRKPEHLLKFILKELATPGDLKKAALIIGRKISAASINEKIKKYANEFVLCRECGKPDTQIVTENNISYLRCLACGNKNYIKLRI
jgi:translation initiation factor 2 subunit 2